MLKVFRDNIKYLSWVLWAVIALFVLFVFVDFGSGLGQQQQAGTTAARVGDETVTVAEFQRQYQELESMYRQIYGEQFTPEVAQQLRLPIQALDRAVNQKILLGEAERLGLKVSDSELRDYILGQTVFQDDQGNFIGEEKYSQILQANRYTVPRFEAESRDQILLQKLASVLQANLYVSDDEVERSYRNEVEKAKIRYLQLPRNRFLQGVEIPQNELAAYFEQHKEELRLPEQRDVAYVVVDNAKLFGQVKVEDKDIQDYYNANQAEFTSEEQVRVRHVLVMVNDARTDEAAKARIAEAQKKLQGGADFAAVSAEYSEDTASKANGGDLGYFGRNRMVKEFEDAAFGAPLGKLVGPVKTSFGYHLLEVTDKRPGGAPALPEVREQIRARLQGVKVQQAAEAKAKELAARLAKEKPKSAADLEAIAKADPTLAYALTGKFGEGDPVAGMGRSAPFNSAAFSLKKGEVSEAVQMPRGWGVLYVVDVFEPSTPTLAEVEPKVRLAVAQQRQQQEAMERLAQAKTALSAGKTLDQVAVELGVEVKESEEFGGDGNIPGIGYNPELTKAALSLQNGQAGGPVADSQGGILFQVAERKAWDPAQFATAKDQTRTRLQQEKLSRFQGALIEKRRRELGVNYDKQLLTELGIEVPQQI
jgi:peptidyl-prolyl cis-trans isomerase D